MLMFEGLLSAAVLPHDDARATPAKIKLRTPSTAGEADARSLVAHANANALKVHARPFLRRFGSFGRVARETVSVNVRACARRATVSAREARWRDGPSMNGLNIPSLGPGTKKQRHPPLAAGGEFPRRTSIRGRAPAVSGGADHSRGAAPARFGCGGT